MPLPPLSPAAAGGPWRQSGRRAGWFLFAAVMAASLTSILTLLPPVLVLPALSLLLVIAGLCLGAGRAFVHAALHVPRPRFGTDAFDVAGAFLLVGFVAALIADAEAAMALVERWLAEHSPAPAPAE